MKATTLHLALIGDYNPDVTAHQAIPVALQQAADALGLSVQWHWLDTDSITPATELHTFDGFWCVPASPYRDADGALRAIRFAREQKRPFLGTCGGFNTRSSNMPATCWAGRMRSMANWRPRPSAR